MATKRRKPGLASAPSAPAAGERLDSESGAPDRASAESSPPEPHGFPIVGIGASAGGLAAVEELLAAFPPGAAPGMALVLVQHLDPDHDSLLLELVERCTTIPVAWAQDGVRVRIGRAYIMPPNTEMQLVAGRLVVHKPEQPRGLRLPIDRFFRSLAADQRENAVCVVLSGTGSDGTLGLRAIKGEGGMAIVQSPESAAFDGMPRSAIATGLADYVIPPAEMPEQLLGYLGRAFSHVPQADMEPEDDSPTDLLRMMSVLREYTGHDFTHYKTSTLRRRVDRRMAVTKCASADDYLALLGRDKVEAGTLFRDLLIGVTSFFRDPEAFDMLVSEALPTIIEARSADDPVRVWVPGCSTGEEAYSIAILMLEQVAKIKRHVPVQVFATDIDVEAIERARAGVYPANIAADVTPDRLERFFVKTKDTYRVAKSVRECLVFAKQDVTRDPPFSKVDLISCRNMLIYMDSHLQRSIMPVFHYALNADGYLLLGSSESVGDAADLFEPVDQKWRLFRRRGDATPRRLSAASVPSRRVPAGNAGFGLPEKPIRIDVRELAEKRLLEQHSPACAVVNVDGNVLYIHGHTGRYLEPEVGEPTGSILKMARDGIRLELASGLRKAHAENRTVRYDHVRVGDEGDASFINLVVEPLASLDEARGVMMVLFEEVAVSEETRLIPAEPLSDREQRIADLDRELTAKEEHLRTTIEVLETSNEELMSTNEELQSANEELQSTNEELETSREELQSVNEELITVNDELESTVKDLSRANNDMSNMFAGTGIGTLFVDRDVKIARYTPAVSHILSLIPTDVGRPLSDMASRLTSDTDLLETVTRVLDTLATVDARVASVDRTYQMRVQPYRTLDNVIEGAVLTFVDITEQQQLQAERDELARISAAEGRLAQSILDSGRQPTLVLDGAFDVAKANHAFLEAFAVAPGDVVGKPLSEIDGAAWNRPELLSLLEEVLPEKTHVDDFALTLVSAARGSCDVSLTAVELVQAVGAERLILLTIAGMSWGAD